MPSKRPLVRRSIVFLAMTGFFIAGFTLLLTMFVNVVPKRAMTYSAMTETSLRIGTYFRQNRHLPADLSVLPVRDNYANRTTDAWDRPLAYIWKSDDTFTLSSLGKDGIAGGTGDDADVVQKYRVEGGDVQRVRELVAVKASSTAE